MEYNFTIRTNSVIGTLRSDELQGEGKISYFSVMCSSRKNPYPPNGRSLEIPMGWGLLKVKILEAKYEAFLGEGGAKQKTFCGEENGYFLELHNVLITYTIKNI